MATGPGRYDGVRELRSRLPDVPDTVIAYFLSKVGGCRTPGPCLLCAPAVQC